LICSRKKRQIEGKIVMTNGKMLITSAKND